MAGGASGEEMTVTVYIRQGKAGLFFAESADAPTFTAAHFDKQALIAMLPTALEAWNKSQDRAEVIAAPAKQAVRKGKAKRAPRSVAGAGFPIVLRHKDGVDAGLEVAI